MRKNNISIGILGLWHLGLVYSVCLAKLGYKVFGFDQSKENTDNLRNGNLPIYEPNIRELFNKNLNRNLFISKDAEEVIKKKDYIFVTLDTPLDDNDEIDLTSLNKLFNLLIKYSSKKTTIIISSQIPLGTTRRFVKRFGPNVIYFPENLRLGNALEDFFNPARIVLGTDNEKVINKFLKDFPIFTCKVLRMSLESAEMLKHALNSYLALNISFSSELSDLCEALGANAKDVVLGLKSDLRVSPRAPLNPGIGFAGGTLGRDVKTLIKFSGEINYSAKLLKAVYEVNQDRLKYLLKKIKIIHPKLSGKKIGILGLTYKPDTDTLRRSQSLELADMLANEKAEVRGFDPVVKNINSKSINLSNSLEEFLTDLDSLILMTPWSEFKNIDPKLAAKLMRKKILIDTKNFLDQQVYKKSGFEYFGIGEGK